MKKREKILAILLVLLVVVGAAVAFYAKGSNLTGFMRLKFTPTVNVDLKDKKLSPKVNLDLMKKVDPDTFAEVLRGEFVKKLVVAAGLELVNPEVATFTDVPKNSQYYKYVETAVKNGILMGYPNATFGVTATISRAEAAKATVLAFDFTLINSMTPTFKDVAKNTWFYTYVETLYANGVLPSNPKAMFYPNNYLTNGEFSKWLANI